jgi:hypothetical protein
LATHLPKSPEDLWEVLIDFDSDSRQALFAHFVSLTLNAVHEAYNRRPGALAHADILATALTLDMVAVGWTPTAEVYLARVTKAQILEAVREPRRVALVAHQNPALHFRHCRATALSHRFSSVQPDHPRFRMQTRFTPPPKGAVHARTGNVIALGACGCSKCVLRRKQGGAPDRQLAVGLSNEANHAARA